jgi:hypothetical protein
MTVDWEAVRKEFEPEGSLRDIYVSDAGLAGWQSLLAALRHFDPAAVFTVDGEERELPDDASTIFDVHEVAKPMLVVRWAGLSFYCHFFIAEEIELDLDPREVHDATDFEAVLDFLAFVGDTVGKPAVLTAENAPERPILRYDPVTRTTEHFR